VIFILSNLQKKTRKFKTVRNLSLLLAFCLVLLSLTSCIKTAYTGIDAVGGSGADVSADKISENSKPLDEITTTQITVATEAETADIVESSSECELSSDELTATAPTSPDTIATEPTTTAKPTTTKPPATKAPATTKPTTTKPSTTKPSTTKPTTTNPPATTVPPTTAPPSYRPDGDKGVMFDSINRERTSRGLAPLVWDKNVAAAAQDKADEMGRLNRFDHVSPTYGTTRNMLENQRKLNVNWVGENLAGYKCVNDAHCGQMNSQKHRDNILNPNYTHVGIGIAPHPKYGQVFVIMFVSYVYW